ncbi:imidazolonepropionase [Aneurinibacillus uraniidurans]|uniref:imidazolonepropionase n=1 Tax=Aneurinibacillus uraniidurans TaxID=2966586 RepID=UPI00234BE46C|nr:imidazolonepropionase [Aneurinibacillus sp. B1]WCN39788.1 imidazolonepropionase [Aneurinibacillus sp. B1]
MKQKPILLRHAAQLVTLQGTSAQPVTGTAMSNLHIIEDGAVWIEDGSIQMVDRDEVVTAFYQDRLHEADVIDASGKVVTPGLIDPHTHLVFAGSRENEFEMRLAGKTYMEIMNAGGGIHNTTRATQAASEEELYKEAYQRLNRFLQYGVTTVEAKSGYGLTLEHEMKQLHVAKQLQDTHPIDIVSTFMGAHAVPAEYKHDPDRFVDILVNEMIPEVAKSGLAQFNDVFCEHGVFTPEQSERILRAGMEHGLLPKIHADEIEPYQGAELAARLGAVSADHLLRASDEGIRQMAEKGVVAVLLPGTAFFLKAEAANGRKMIDAGVAVALSTDRNPGSSPSESMPFIMNLGCLTMGMTPAEVLVAATINAAHAIKQAHRVGSLEKGKAADLVVFDAPNYSYMQYNYGVNLVDTVIKAGKIVVQKGSLTHEVSVSPA